MPTLEYERWERFEDAIDRAKATAANVGTAPLDHFREAGKVIKGGRWGEQTVADLHLTRYACYLVAMNGDSRKRAVAAAQTYFAVKTREAEVASQSIGDELAELEVAHTRLGKAIELAKAERARAELAETKVAELAPKADLADRYLSVPTGGRILREVAKALGLKETALRKTLTGNGVIFQRHADCGKQYWDAQARYFTEPNPKFRAKEVVVTHDGGIVCMHYTLYILQSGVDLICRMTGRGQQMDLEVASQ
jgi:DNA-damage-inducible protein D